jgi:hypothetical protein
MGRSCKIKNAYTISVRKLKGRYYLREVCKREMG